MSPTPTDRASQARAPQPLGAPGVSTTAGPPRAGMAGVAPGPPPDLWTSLGVLGRHWKLVLVGTLLTVGAAVAAFTLVGVRYEAKSSQILLAPNAPGGASPAAAAGGRVVADAADDGAGNPYLEFGSTLNVTADVLATSLADEQTEQVVADRGGTGEYLVEPPRSEAPIVWITATAENPGDAVRTAGIVTGLLEERLRDQQATTGAPRSTWITAEALQVPGTAAEQQTSRIRGIIAVLVLGLTCTVLAAFAAESLGNRRAARRRQRDGLVPATTGPVDLPVDDAADRSDTAPTHRVDTPSVRADEPQPDEVAGLARDAVRAGRSRDGLPRRSRSTVNASSPEDGGYDLLEMLSRLEGASATRVGQD